MIGELTTTQHLAAIALGQGKTQTEAASVAGVRFATVARWLKQDAFIAATAVEAARIQAAIRAEGIANRQNRIDAYNDRWERLNRVIEQRAEAHAGQTPGGDTGLMVLTVRYLPGGGRVEEWAVDTGTLAELRATEKQAAQELEQWNEKPGAVRDDRITVEIVHVQAADRSPRAASSTVDGDFRESAVQRGLLRAPLGEDGPR